MKKAFCFLLIFAMLAAFAGCGKEEQAAVIYKDTLVITNTDKTFQGARSRYNSVLTSLKTKVNILEKCQNDRLIADNPDNYFLDKDYIYSAFEPFVFQKLDITDRFDDSLTADSAPSAFETDAGGKSVVYSGDEKEKTLKFVDEQITEILTAEYDKRSDSFRCSYSVENAGDEKAVEFLEFVTVDENTYAIQSQNTRCWIAFDENGYITYFVCVQLKSDEITSDDSIFKAGSAAITEFKNKVSRAKKSDYDKIHEFEDGTLYYTDITKEDTISIYADAYKSAFV
jgi:hypothetical protein